MQICSACCGGEIKVMSCLKCGGSGFISRIENKKKKPKPIQSVLPAAAKKALRSSSKKRTRRAKRKIKNESLKREDEVVAPKKLSRGMYNANKSSKDIEKQKKKFIERRRKERLKNADKIQEDVIGRDLHPAQGKGTIAGPGSYEKKNISKEKNKAKKRRARKNKSEGQIRVLRNF